MSLVLEALRRVDKPDDKTGSIGAVVSSYRPGRRRQNLTLPLLLGLATGAALLVPFGPRSTNLRGTSASSPSADSLPILRQRPPAITAGARSQDLAASIRGVQPGPVARAAPAPRTGSAEPATAASDRQLSRRPGKPDSVTSDQSRPMVLTLQAISERDSYPIAIINDQLFKEGDMIGRTRILRINSDSVDVLLESGKRETVRFGPPSAPALSPSSDSR